MHKRRTWKDAEADAARAGGSLPRRRPRGAYVLGARARDRRSAAGDCWHGEVPWRPECGYGSTSPAGSYPANGFVRRRLTRESHGLPQRRPRSFHLGESPSFRFISPI